MFVKAQSKQRFGENKTPFINVEQMVAIELGHDGNIVAKMSNAEEFVILADQAKVLLAFLEKNQLQ